MAKSGPCPLSAVMGGRHLVLFEALELIIGDFNHGGEAMMKLGLAHKMLLVVCLPCWPCCFFRSLCLRALPGRAGDERGQGRAGGGEEAAQLAHELQRSVACRPASWGRRQQVPRCAARPAQGGDTLLQRFRQEPALRLTEGATGSGRAHRHA